MELQQKSLLQTAVAVFTNSEGAEIQVPLFSKKPLLLYRSKATDHTVVHWLEVRASI